MATEQPEKSEVRASDSEHSRGPLKRVVNWFEHPYNRERQYNLKLPVAFFIVALSCGPFIYDYIRISNLSVQEALQYDFSNYRAAIAAFGLTLPVFLLLGYSHRFARLCARDPDRVSETISTARYCSLVIALLLILCIVLELVP